MGHRTKLAVVVLAVLASAGYLGLAWWSGGAARDTTWGFSQIPGHLWLSWAYVGVGLTVWARRPRSAIGWLTVAIGFAWLAHVFDWVDQPVPAALADLAPTLLLTLFACLVVAFRRQSTALSPTMVTLVLGFAVWVSHELLTVGALTSLPGYAALFPAVAVWPVEVLLWIARTPGSSSADLRFEHDIATAKAEIVETMNAVRRSAERDLHDGVQQRLVNLGVSLSLAQTQLSASPEARAALDRAVRDLDDALRELRELAAGIYPAILGDAGLGPALESMADRAAVPVELTGVPGRRLSPRIEETAYFLVSEAVTNAVKHARAERIAVELRDTGDRLRLTVRDDGVGGADPSGGGLRGLSHRAAAVGGELRVESLAGAGTRVTALLPAR
ncbi:sensor histidine kinase [Nonomuraea sp. NPDC046802]|uniref:sensor histidine kinase n=1 Tax=Nonomuraea sp. NPDC046802 TaxID=3154919 RepID=UPI0033F33518